MRTESNHCMVEGTKPEPKPAKCVPLPGKEDLNEKTEGSNRTGHSLEVPAQVAKIDLLLEVGNSWDPEKRTIPPPPPPPPSLLLLFFLTLPNSPSSRLSPVWRASQGRRCYNMLHDIQEDIIGLSVDCNSLAFVPLGASDEPSKATREAATCTRRHRVRSFVCLLVA